MFKEGHGKGRGKVRIDVESCTYQLFVADFRWPELQNRLHMSLGLRQIPQLNRPIPFFGSSSSAIVIITSKIKILKIKQAEQGRKTFV